MRVCFTLNHFPDAIADSDKPGEILIEGLTGQPLFLSDHSVITWRQEEEGLRIVFESACEMPVTMKFANSEDGAAGETKGT